MISLILPIAELTSEERERERERERKKTTITDTVHVCIAL